MSNTPFKLPLRIDDRNPRWIFDPKRFIAECADEDMAIALVHAANCYSPLREAVENLLSELSERNIASHYAEALRAALEKK